VSESSDVRFGKPERMLEVIVNGKKLYQDIIAITDNLGNLVDVRDTINRADRLLGRVYGSQGEQLKQRAITYELMVQLVHQGVEYQAGGGAGGLVQCQTRNEADTGWINEPFIRKIITDQLPSALTVSGNLKVAVLEGGAGGGLSQLQVRNASNVWNDVGYYTGNLNVPVQAIDLDIRNLQKTLDEVYGVLRTDIGVAYDARQIRALTSSDIISAVQSGIWSTGRTWNLSVSDIPDLSDRVGRLLGIIYGDVGQLLQRPTTRDLLVQLRNAGTEIDPRSIRALTSSDVVDISDRALRDMGKIDIAAFDVSLPSGTNNIGDVDVISMPNVVQAAKDRYITDVTKTVTQKIVNLTATGIIHTPTTGKKIRIKGFTWSSNADVVTALRFGTTGDLLFAIQAKGVIGMNLMGANIEGAVDEALYGYLSGTGNMKGTALIEEV